MTSAKKDFLIKKGKQHYRATTGRSVGSQTEGDYCRMAERVHSLEEEVTFLNDEGGVGRLISQIEGYNKQYLKRIQDLEKTMRQDQRHHKD